MKIEESHITNNLGENINSATDETLLMLRKMVKMLESKTVVDSQMKQRVTVDSASSAIGPYSISNIGTNYPTNVAPGINTTVYYMATWNGPIDPRWTNVEQARITYNTNIRNKLN